MNEITKAEMRKRLSNITQLQELLFGEKIDEYNHKLEQHSQKIDYLEANCQKFQLVTEERLIQLEKKLNNRINSVANSLDKKVKYLNISTQKEQKKMQQELDRLSKKNDNNMDFLQNSLNANTNNLKTEITQVKSALDRDMQLLKQQVFEKLKSNLLELSNNKVSRGDLAEVLFEISLQLKESDVDLALPERENNQEIHRETPAHADLMLTETKS